MIVVTCPKTEKKCELGCGLGQRCPLYPVHEDEILILDAPRDPEPLVPPQVDDPIDQVGWIAFVAAVNSMRATGRMSFRSMMDRARPEIEAVLADMEGESD